jgi:hypothetical protein
VIELGPEPNTHFANEAKLAPPSLVLG